MNLVGIGTAINLENQSLLLSQAAHLTGLGYQLDQTRLHEKEPQMNLMAPLLIGLVPHQERMPQALSQQAHLMALECQEVLHKCQDQVSIQMLLVGTGTEDNHKSPYQHQVLHQRRN